MQSEAWNNIYAGAQWPTNWDNLSSGLAVTSFYRLGLSANNPSRLIAGAQDNSTYITDGSSWLNIIGGDGMECIRHPNNPSVLWGSWQYGSIVRSDNGGLNTQSVSSQIQWSFGDEGEWTTPYTLHKFDPDFLVAGYGQVYLSFDQGDNFTPISTFQSMQGSSNSSPASAVALAPSTQNVIYVAKRIYHGFNQPTQVWHTDDMGDTWNEITNGLPDSLYITYMAVDDNYPDRAWATAGGFVDGVKVFRTDDAGQSWQNISGNLPNLPANCVVHHDSSEHDQIYIGMDVGIFYTNDTMNGQWELYAENLPNVIVSELEIDYQNNQLYAATFGRGVWRADLLTVGIDTTPAPPEPVDTTPPVGYEAALLHALTLTVSPNPAQGSFSISASGLLQQDVELRMLDVRGRVVYTERFPAFEGRLQRNIHPQLPGGMYFVQLTNGTAFKATRLVLTE